MNLLFAPELRTQIADGRPSVSAAQFESLRRSHDVKFGPSKAARIAGVHRNTASMYYKLFRSGATIVLKIRAPELPPQADAAKDMRAPQSPPGRRPKLFYPYVTNGATENSLIEEVNALVPKGLEPDLRADICQDIVVAILGGLTSIGALRQSKGEVRTFIKQVYRNNFEDDGDATPFNFEWLNEEMAPPAVSDNHSADRRTHQLTFYANATQVDDVYHSQLRQVHKGFSYTDTPISFDEVEEIFGAEL